MLLDEITVDPEFFLPGRFQIPGDEAILRLHGVILTRRSLLFVGSTLQSLLPERPGRVALMMEVVRDLQADLQGWRHERLEGQPHHLLVESLSIEALAARLAQASLVGRAGVSRLVRPTTVLRAEAVATAATDDQPGQQSPARTYTAPARVP